MNVVERNADFAAVTCADRGMLPAACCALQSVGANLSRPARLMLVAVDISDGDAAGVESFSRRHGLDIEVIAFDSARLPAVEKGRWPKAVLTRLFLGDVLPPGIRRLLYVDADTLAVDSLDTLTTADLAGNCAGAVDDYIMAFPAKLQARRVALGLAADSSYFNSGVILLDWQDPRAKDVLAIARHKLAEFSSNYHATDQDALNAALDGKWTRLDPRWNTQTGFMRFIRDPAIVHFTGRRKPWQRGGSWRHRDYAPVYRSALEGTLWEGVLGTPPRWNAIMSLAQHAAKQLEDIRKEPMVRAYLEKTRGQGPGTVKR